MRTATETDWTEQESDRGPDVPVNFCFFQSSFVNSSSWKMRLYTFSGVVGNLRERRRSGSAPRSVVHVGKTSEQLMTHLTSKHFSSNAFVSALVAGWDSPASSVTPFS